jgi:hypothetical protein
VGWLADGTGGDPTGVEGGIGAAVGRLGAQADTRLATINVTKMVDVWRSEVLRRITIGIRRS